MAETGEYSFKLKIDNQQLNLDIEQAKKAFADLAKQAKKAGAVFDDIPNPFDSIGKSAPKVEAAKKQFDALGMSVSQLARETPALAMGVNTYIMAISNNLPVFADAVKKVREENAALAAQGKPTVSVLKQVGSALISWQTLLIAVVTTLAMNGDKVWAWVKGLFSAKDALDDVARAEKALLDVRRQGTIAAQEEVTKIRLTVQAAQDATASIEERTNAIRTLKKEYPDYFANLSSEQIMYGDIADSVQALVDKTIALAQARKAFNQLVENEENLQLLQGMDSYAEFESANAAYEARGRKEREMQLSGGQYRQGVTREYLAWDKAQDKLLKDLKNGGEEAGKLLELIEDKYDSDVDAFIKATQASNAKLEEDAQGVIADGANTAAEAAQRAAELRAKQIADASARLMVDAQRATTQAEVDAMAEGILKKIAQINLNYDLEEQAITKREEELKKLRGGMLTAQEQQSIDAMRKANVGKRDRNVQGAYNEVFADAVAWMKEAEKEMNAFGKEVDKALAKQMGAWEDYHIKYGTIKEQLLATTQKYNRLIAEAENDAERKTLEAERDALLAEYSVQASAWAQELVDMSTTRLTKMLKDLQVELEAKEAAYDALDSSDSASAEEYRNTINELRAKIASLQEELGKAKRQTQSGDWAGAAEVFHSIASAANETADGLEGMNDGLAEGLKAFGQLAGAAGSLVSAISMVVAASGALNMALGIIGLIAAAINAVLSVVSLFKDNYGVEETMRQFEELNKEIERTRELARIDSWKGTIFGEDAFGNFTNNVEVLRDASQALEESQKAIMERNKFGRGYDSIEKAIGSMQVKTRDRSGFAEAFGAKDEYANLGDLMPSLFGEDGKITLKGLQELRDSDVWDKISEENRNLIDDMIADWELYEEATEAVEEYLSDVFGEFGNDISDALIDAFKNGTDAAEAFANATSNIMERLAQDIVNMALLEPIMQGAENQILELQGQLDRGEITNEQYLSLVESILKNTIDQAQGVADEANRMYEAAGIEQGSTKQQTYAKGFQTMSQETGSELNGRFTDIQGQTHRIAEAVEFCRGLQAQQAQHLQSVSSTLASIHNDTSLIAQHTKALARMDDNLDAMRRAIDNGAI